MLKFLFIMFFFFILLVFLMGFSIFRAFKYIFFGKDTNVNKNSSKRSQEKTSSNNPTSQSNSSAEKKKIFSKDEGEYVDYEEVK